MDCKATIGFSYLCSLINYEYSSGGVRFTSLDLGSRGIERSHVGSNPTYYTKTGCIAVGYTTLIWSQRSVSSNLATQTVC